MITWTTIPITRKCLDNRSTFKKPLSQLISSGRIVNSPLVREESRELLSIPSFSLCLFAQEQSFTFAQLRQEFWKKSTQLSPAKALQKNTIMVSIVKDGKIRLPLNITIISGLNLSDMPQIIMVICNVFAKLSNLRKPIKKLKSLP